MQKNASAVRKSHLKVAEPSAHDAPDEADHAQAIAQAAYYKAERRHFEPGHEVEDWLEAERELQAPQLVPRRN
jgi:hypothetical protein